MFFLDKIILRTPLFPFKRANDSELFEEAIYIASPVLYKEYKKFIANSLNPKKEVEKVKQSVYKYKSRAQYRCTPFGIFAGLNIGKWGDKNQVELNSNIKNILNRKVKLDMNVLCTLVSELVKLSCIKPYLKFYPNSSIYSYGDSYRYVEYQFINNFRSHKISKVDSSHYLKNILDKCSNGYKYQQICDLLVSSGIDIRSAQNFIDEVIEAQLLVHELEPRLTGKDYFDFVLANLKEIYSSNQNYELQLILQYLDEIRTLIKKSEDCNKVNRIEIYKAIFEKIKVILKDKNETNLLQIDLYKKTEKNSVQESIKHQLENTVKFLNKISPPTTNSNLERFTKRFSERYEEQEVSLLHALDNETGIGYPISDDNGINSLVDDLHLQKNNNEQSIKWDSLQASLLKLIIQGIKEEKKIIQVTENDFKGIDFSKEIIPSSFSIMFKVLNAETNKLSVSGIGGSSAINLLGRFSEGNKEIKDLLLEISQYEESQMPGKIFAEIVHLPESRTGNILSRANIRQYEIPYLAMSSVDIDFQVRPADLVLKIQNNNIILLDKRLNKEVIPRLGNAHNYNNGLPIYHFLCDLQNQYFSKSYIGFNWGALSEHFNYLPRIEYQNTVVSPAKWQLNKDDLLPFKNKTASLEENQKLFFKLKDNLQLPRYFIIADGDNELLIDCDDTTAVSVFLSTIKKRDDITLEEYLFDDVSSLVKDTDGNYYTNECIALVLNDSKIISYNTNNSKTFDVKREFSIGDEWLYYKIYCGSKTADFILIEKIKAIADTLEDKGIIDKWFFIRYLDPEKHLRLRFHISDFTQYNTILKIVHDQFSPLVSQNIISRIQTDTYKRELERYGDKAIGFVENLFYYDSMFTISVLETLKHSDGKNRWQVALISIDNILNDFELRIEEKCDLTLSLRESYFKEYNGDKDLQIKLDTKYRSLKTDIQLAMENGNWAEEKKGSISSLIKQRSKHNKPEIKKIIGIHKSENLSEEISKLIANIIHMHLNRLFMGKNRINEFIIYDFLSRYYKTKIFRDFKKTSETT